MLSVSWATHALAWVLLASVRTCLLSASSARAYRHLTQLSQSRPRTFLPEDPIVPEAGQDANTEQTFGIAKPAFDSQFKVQFNSSWALDRIDQPSLPLDSQFKFPNSADSVSVYVLDSGILAAHEEFETQSADGDTGGRTRARDVYTSSQISQKAATESSKAQDSSSESWMTGSAPREDCSGHGTHVASLVGGFSFGVAKGVQLKAVRVLACDGSTSASSVIDALEWLGRNAERPAIAVVAVAQTGHIPSLDHAVERLVMDGVPVFAAAGNSDASACDVAPAYSPFAITVGASDYNDERLKLPDGVGSNYGPCIDLFAPGLRVPGASTETSDSGIRLSGSSQAVALAAGAAALHMHAAPNTSPAQLRQALVSAAAVGKFSENVPEDYVTSILAPYGASGGAGRSGAAARTPPMYLPAAPLDGGLSGGGTLAPERGRAEGGEPQRGSERADRATERRLRRMHGWEEVVTGGTTVSTCGRSDPITSYNESSLVATGGDTVVATGTAMHAKSVQRKLFEAQGSTASETAAMSLIPGAKRTLGHAPFLQIGGLDSVPLVATSPAMITVLPGPNSAVSGLEKIFGLKISLSRRADSDADILIAETSSLRVTNPTQIADTDTRNSSRAKDMVGQGNSARAQVSWVAPQRFGGPFAATLHKGAESVSLQLPFNDSLAMSSQASGAFFLSVVITSDDGALDRKQIPVQVIDRKGWKASYPKVVMGTPYQDSMFTGGAGAELQKVMNLSPCLGSDRERQSLQLDGTPGDDVVYFFKPTNACNAVVSLCGSTVATELVVLSHVDQADVGYLFIIRGRFGYTGQSKFRLECGNTAGQLPSWAGSDAPLPSPLTSLEKGILHNSVASNAPQVPITLGWSPCAVQATPNQPQQTNHTSSSQPNEDSNSNSSANNNSSAQTPMPSALRVSTTSTLALLPGNNPKWCPFCVHGETSQAICTTPPLATAADVISDAWSACESACRVGKSDRAQFCSVPVACVPGKASESQQLCRNLDYDASDSSSSSSSGSSQNQPKNISPLSSINRLRTPQQQDPSGTFHVLQSPHVCGVSEDVLQDTRVQACSDQTAPQSSQCELPTWQWQEFGDCSKPCGGGTREMRVMCVASSGRFRKDTECSDLKPPRPNEEPCNTHACTQTMWHAEKWGPCEEGGMHTRTVKCMQVEAGGNRADVEDSQCELSVKPVQTARCDNTPDDAVFECLAGDCYKGNCTQSGAYCECELGWHGQRCDTRVDCPGLTSSGGDCCTNLRGADTSCCGAAQVLDRNGMCCDNDKLDVCRVCNGNATALDLVGTCGRGALDAGGLLCEGRLDECGVCGGTGLSCDMYALVSAALVYYPVSQLRLPLEQDHRQQVLQTAVLSARQMLAEELELPSTELGLNVSAHAWQGAEAASGAVWVAPLSIQVRFAPLAIPRTHSRSLNLYWLRGVLEGLASRAEMSLADDEESLAVEAAAAAVPGNGSEDNGIYSDVDADGNGTLQRGDAVKVLLSGVSAVGREAVCGNAICEVGELLPVQASGSIGQPCLADCPVEVIGCPQNDAGDICSGHGVCIHGTGLCGCDVGYRGEACDVCAPSHFRKDGYCVTPLISNQRPTSSGTSISPLVIVITVAALVALLFVLGVTFYALYSGQQFCCWCFNCCACLKKRKGGTGGSGMAQKGHDRSILGADSLTEDVLRQSGGIGGFAASGSAPGSPTCFLIDAFSSDQDPKRSDISLQDSSPGDQPQHRVVTALDSQGQVLNSYSLSFQTATSWTSPARQRHTGQTRLNAASLYTSDADNKTVSSAVLSPDDVSVQLPSDSRGLNSNLSSKYGGKVGVSPVATTTAHVHATPTKGGKCRWSEVQHESSAKLSHSSRVIPNNTRTSIEQYHYQNNRDLGDDSMGAQAMENIEKRDKVKITRSLCDSPGEALGALINHWKRASDVRGRRSVGIGSWFAHSRWATASDKNRSIQSQASTQPDLAAFSQSAAAPTAPFHGLHSSSNPPGLPNSTLNSNSNPPSSLQPPLNPPGDPPNNPHLSGVSQGLSKPGVSSSFAPTNAPPGGVSFSQPVTYTSRSASVAHSISASSAQGISPAHQKDEWGGKSQRGALNSQISGVSGISGVLGTSKTQNSRPRRNLGWVLHRNGSRGRSQHTRIGAMHDAESSLLSKQPSQASDSIMPNSSSFWHHASHMYPQRSHSLTSTFFSNARHPTQHRDRTTTTTNNKSNASIAGPYDRFQYQQHHPQRRMERNDSNLNSRRRSSSLPADSGHSGLRVTPFAPPESPPSLVPPSTMPSSTMDGMGDSTTDVSNLIPGVHLPVRAAVAADATAADTAANPVLDSSRAAKTAQNGLKDDLIPQPEEELPDVRESGSRTGISTECSRGLSSSESAPHSSTIQVDDTSTDAAGSSIGGPPVYPRYIYHRTRPSEPSMQASAEPSRASNPAQQSPGHANSANTTSVYSSTKLVEATSTDAADGTVGVSVHSNVKDSNSMVSKPHPRASKPSQDKHKPGSSEKLHTAANSTMLWSPGMVPGDLSSFFASEEGDTFMSHRPKPAKAGKSGPEKCSYASSQACANKSPSGSASDTVSQGKGAPDLTQGSTLGSIPVSNLEEVDQVFRDDQASRSENPTAAKVDQRAPIPPALPGAADLHLPVASSVGSALTKLQHDPTSLSISPTPPDTTCTEAKDLNASTFFKVDIERHTSLNGPTFPIPATSETSLAPNSTLYAPPSSTDPTVLPTVLDSGLPRLSGVPGWATKQPPAVFRNLSLYSNGNASTACTTLSGPPQSKSTLHSPVEPPCFAQVGGKLSTPISTSKPGIKHAGQPLSIAQGGGKHAKSTAKSPPQPGGYAGQQPACVEPGAQGGMQLKGLPTQPRGYAANMLWKREGVEEGAVASTLQRISHAEEKKIPEKLPEKLLASQGKTTTGSGVENKSTVGNVNDLKAKMKMRTSPFAQAGALSSNQTALKTKESNCGGLSQYQSTQVQSEMHANSNLSGLETGHPLGCVLESAALEDGVSGIGPAPSDALSRNSSLRSKSSTSRMVMSREQLAWEHFGSVSDGGALVPTTFNLGAIQNSIQNPADLESPNHEDALRRDGRSAEGFGPVLHSPASHGFGMSADLGTEISNLMNKVQRMQLQAARGLSDTSQSSSVSEMPVFSSPRGAMSHDSSFSISRSSVGGRSGTLDKFAGSSIVPSKVPDAQVVGDSMELNFMHGMAVWTHEENIS